MEARNPFTPSFGRVPAHYAGRSQFMDTMKKALLNGPSDPNLSMILVGPRGVGKTALLSSVAHEAGAVGWVAAQVSAGQGMLQDIEERAREVAFHLVGPADETRIKSLTVGQTFGVEFERGRALQGNWRTHMNGLLDQLKATNTGLLITVDEVRADVDEMRQLAMVYQHFVGEGRNVALVMAGLPSNIAQLISDESVSFLRRARQCYLGRIADGDIEIAFRRTIADGGASIADDALAEAVRAIEGYPYMLQLVGYWTWEQADSPVIVKLDVERGVRLATQELRDGVLAATYRELSKGDIRFLEAMLDDAGSSSLSDISSRMGVKSNYASKYKERLLVSGILRECGGGTYAVDLPGFKDFVREKRGF